MVDLFGSVPRDSYTSVIKSSICCGLDPQTLQPDPTLEDQGLAEGALVCANQKNGTIRQILMMMIRDVVYVLLFIVFLLYEIIYDIQFYYHYLVFFS